MAAVAQNPFGVFEQTAPPGVSRKGQEISPSNSAELEFVCRYLWVGTAGHLHVLDESGNDLTFKNVPVGLFNAVCIRKVFATGTGAQDLVALQ